MCVTLTKSEYGLLEGEEPIDKDPGVSDTVGLGEFLEDTVGLFVLSCCNKFCT